MVVLFGSFLLGLALVLAVGLWVILADVQLAWLRPVGWGRKLAERTNFGVAGVLIALAGTQLVFLFGLPMGWLAKGLEKPLDVPTFHWVYGHASRHGLFTDSMKILTKMGNIFEIRVMCVVAAIALGVAWRRYFYVPALVILATFILEKFAQKSLAKVIDRGHPPTTLGTYPSGGCARLLSIVGVMVFLALLVVPSLSRRWKVGVWTVFAVAVWCEAFSRLYLSKHWFTDVVAGLVFGGMLLVAVVSATSALLSNLAPAFGGSAAGRATQASESRHSRSDDARPLADMRSPR